MKAILLFTFVLYCIPISFSQQYENHFEKLNFEDSVSVVQFLRKVHRIELCELGTTCYMDSVYDKELNQNKVVKRCYLQGALNNNFIDHSKIVRKKLLKPAKLVKFLAGTIEKQDSGVTLCYNPRNAILFYNEKGEIISYLEICFECYHIRWRDNFGFIGFTTDQYVKLESFFIKNGLKTK